MNFGAVDWASVGSALTCAMSPIGCAVGGAILDAAQDAADNVVDNAKTAADDTINKAIGQASGSAATTIKETDALVKKRADDLAAGVKTTVTYAIVGLGVMVLAVGGVIYWQATSKKRRR
jgi:phage-related protein